jgi:hypothetical protein
MRTMGAFIAALVIAFVVVSALANPGSGHGVVTGVVGEYLPGARITVGNETTDPMGVRLVLRETTVFEGDPALIKPGARVTVSYTRPAERWPVADTVRVVASTPTD